VGLKPVKDEVTRFVKFVRVAQQRKAQGLKVAPISYHMVFTGNPGTGKTTVARILARMMQQAGILRKGHLVEVKGRDLCGQYIGETAPKTSAICRDAYGSVLFIDEAYSLFRDEDASCRDYGREALDTLVAEMENHRDDFCVIMAGYKDDMDAMLKGNAGLKSRIPYEIEFPNYTRDDLEKIFFTMLDGTFEYEEGLRDAVHEFFAEMPEETFASKEFSNARLVRNLYERTWGKAAYRQSLEGGGDLRILKSDLAGAMSDNEFKKLMKKSAERRTIGFGA
jgi:SpoVK/Ycf46/Vps4 family AAA+-type ATPase